MASWSAVEAFKRWLLSSYCMLPPRSIDAAMQAEHQPGPATGEQR